MYVVFFSIQSGRTNHSVNQKQNHDLRDERMKNKNKTINIKVRRRTQQTIIKEEKINKVLGKLVPGTKAALRSRPLFGGSSYGNK